VLFIVGFVFLGSIAISVLRSGTSALAQEPLKPLAQPPEGQTFIGSKNCASCHFDQFLVWKQTPHAKAFDILPAKYRTDSSCLKCHSTGHGQPTGYKDATTAALAGTSCEACHGPGNKHGEIAKQFGDKKLTPEQTAYVRSTIHKVLPGNACTECHIMQSHKKHPPYDKP
jgi:hypothetical protein